MITIESLSFVVVDICIDENVHCNDLASEGECENNPSYMHIVCRKTCQTCGNI